MLKKVINNSQAGFHSRQQVMHCGPYDTQNELLRSGRPAEPFSTGRTPLRSAVPDPVHAVQRRRGWPGFADAHQAFYGKKGQRHLESPRLPGI